MNILQLIDTVKLSYEVKRPVLALSSPGIGKSMSVYQAAQQMGVKYKEQFDVIEIRGASSNPSELADIKAIIDGAVVDLPQDWLPTEEKIAAKECAKRGIIFVDELGDSLPAVQSVLQRLFLDRRLGSLTLAPTWHVVAASNRASDKAAAGRISTALVNRCIVVTVEPDADIFCNWAIENNLNAATIAFTRWRPDCLGDFDPSRKLSNPAFCSPRSMHMASDVLNYEPDPHFEILTGILGDGRGSEFSGFLRIMRDLPDLDKLIREADKYPVPKKMDVAIATLYALIARLNDDNAFQILTYFTRNEVELAVVGIRDLVKIKKDVVTTSEAFKKWASDPRNIRLLT